LNRQKQESHQHFKQDMAAPAHVLVQPEAHDYMYILYTAATLMLCNNCMLTSIQQAYQVAAQAALKQLSYACYHDNNTKLAQLPSKQQSPCRQKASRLIPAQLSLHSGGNAAAFKAAMLKVLPILRKLSCKLLEYQKCCKHASASCCVFAEQPQHMACLAIPVQICTQPLCYTPRTGDTLKTK
jgi:hypothetical protein